jgi:hypothetical protein
LGAAFVLDPAGVTRTRALGSARMARKLRDALPGGDGGLRAAVWEFMRPMLSPGLVSLNRDAFVVDHSVETPVNLDGHRALQASMIWCSARSRTPTPHRTARS